jgi:hypothetical protein
MTAKHGAKMTNRSDVIAHTESLASIAFETKYWRISRSSCHGPKLFLKQQLVTPNVSLHGNQLVKKSTIWQFYLICRKRAHLRERL